MITATIAFTFISMCTFTCSSVCITDSPVQICDNDLIEREMYPQGFIRNPFNSFTGISEQILLYPNHRTVYNAISTGYWSDKLALVPYREYLSIKKRDSWAKLAAQLINQSFDVAGKSAEETSARITEAVHGGVSIFGLLHFTPVDILSGNISAGLQTTMHIKTELPEAPFLVVFSEQNGLKRGSDLPLTHMSLQFSLTTNVNALYLRPFKLDGVLAAFKNISEKWVDIENVSVVNGLTVVFGHAMVDISTQDGAIRLNDDGTEMYANAKLKIRSSGLGIRNDNGFNLKIDDSFPVTGIGAGINTGIVISGKTTVMTMGFRRIGPMIWDKLKQKEITLKTANIVIADMLEHNYDLFDESRGGIVSEVDTETQLDEAGSMVCWLPASLAVTFTHRFDLKYKKFKLLIPEYIMSSFKYDQPLVSWTGMCAKPGVSCVNEFGMVHGYIPLKLGWSFGYGKKSTSFIGAGVNTRNISVLLGFEAVGTPYWYPKRGCSIHLGIISG